jgi:pilus assembly protein CpaE
MPSIELPSLIPRHGLLFCPTPGMAEELERVLSANLPELRWNTYTKYPSTSELNSLLQGGTPHLVFIDASADSKGITNLIGEIGRASSRIYIIALLTKNDPDLILRCLRAGAADFLLQPFSEDQLEAAMATITRYLPTLGQVGREPGKIFAVIPARGACGASTIASSLAYAMARNGAKKVLLADLDPLTGTISFLLKQSSQVSFMDVLNREHELDTGLWGSIVKSVKGIDVLLAPELMEGGLHDLADPAAILDFARYQYDAIITDCASVYGAWNLQQAKQATEILLITTNELPALQAAQRALSYLDANRVGRWKLKLIVNRYHPNAGLSKEMISTALHLDVFDSLPSDYMTVQASLMEGTPIPSATPLGKSITQLARRLLGTAPPAPVKKPSALSGLLDLFSRKS